ncbi:MAG: hypothetical protein N3E38_03315 [Candidatus Aenigmarchaeota archaeon]|nr:hypothetical protein [Candidatus Aenigmarchaeota archaeon]
MKKYFLFLLLLLLIQHTLLQTALAVTASCGIPEVPGNYRFYNRDSTPVRVFINTGGTAISVSPNNFEIPPGGSQLVEVRAAANTYARMFVTYTDLNNNFSAGLECSFYATSGSYTVTTTTQQTSGSCSSYTTPSACRAAGCIWISIGFSGYCTGSGGATTTTTLTTTAYSITPTPTQVTTTTVQPTTSNCQGRSFSTCNLIPGCEWIGNPTSGYCRSVFTQTTTAVATTTTTTTIPPQQNNPPSSSGSTSNSGGSTSTGGASGGGSSKPTGFYDFPSFIQIAAGEEKTIKGTFYAAKDLYDVQFQVADLDANWFTITPSSSTLKKGETINLTVKVKVPGNAKQDSYVFRLVAKTTVNYEKPITLAVVAAPKTTTTTTVITTTTVPQKQSSTGLFSKVGEVVNTYWYFVVIPVGLVITLTALPLIAKQKRSKGSAYAFTEEEQDYTQDFVEIKIREAEQEKSQQLQAPIEKPKRDIDDKIRKKVIKEIRERAMKDKRR